MSFSSELKEELASVYDSARHCRVASLAALVCFLGTVSRDDEQMTLLVSSENEAAMLHFAQLMKLLFDEHCVVRTDKSQRNLKSYSVFVSSKTCPDVFGTLKLINTDDGKMPNIERLTQKNCCARAFLRGAFISSGSVSNPDKFYHFEIPCKSSYTAEGTEAAMHSLGLSARTTLRQNNYVVYLKEIEQIADAIGLMGARKAYLELENHKIVREMRGNVNRRVNCETANINKTAMAAARQIEDIIYIKEHMSLSSLPNGLDEIAQIRLKYPEATLSELGSYLEPPIGKSGVNHRLRKLSSIAGAMRSRGGV